MDKISRGFDFVIGLNFTFGMYSLSHLKVSGRFKKMFLPLNLSLQDQEEERVYIITTKSICYYVPQLNHIHNRFCYLHPLSLSISDMAIDNAFRYRYR